MNLNDVLQINDALEMDEKQERELNEVIVSLHPHKVLLPRQMVVDYAI